MFDFLFSQFKVDIQVQSDRAQKEAKKGEELEKELSQAKSGLRQETLHRSAVAEAIQRKLRAIEDLKINAEQREETLKGKVSCLKKGKWNDGMKRECLSFLKLDRSQTYLAFPFLQF